MPGQSELRSFCNKFLGNGEIVKLCLRKRFYAISAGKQPQRFGRSPTNVSAFVFETRDECFPGVYKPFGARRPDNDESCA